MRKKWQRFLSGMMAFVLAFTMVMASGIGKTVVKAEEEYTWKSTAYIDNGNLNTYVDEYGNGSWWNCAHEWSFTMTDWTSSTCVGDWVSNEHDGALKLVNGTESTNTVSMERTVSTVPAGTYRLTFEQNAQAVESGLTINVLNSDDTEITTLLIPITVNTTDWSSVTTNEFTLDVDSDIKIQVTGAVPVGYWANFDNFVLEQKTLVMDEEVSSNLITNGSFDNAENGLAGWTESQTPEKHQTKDAEDTAADTYGKIYDFYSSTKMVYSMTQTIELSAGSYKLTAEAMGAAGMKVYVYFDGRVSADCVSDPGWNEWTKVGENSVFNLGEDKTVQVGFYIVCEAGGWGDVDNVILEKIDDTNETETQDVADISTDDEEEEVDTSSAISAGIKIDKISNLPSDFIKGVDVSSYISEKNSGVKYYDFEGNELDDQGFFDLLASCGVNYIRIRVWHNPYDEKGNGYGGGTNDLEKAKKIGQWATNAGMKVLIDFHYSDFWTDPGKQYTPKAWEGYDVDQKAAAISTYTKDSLTELLEAGVDVGMVQVGNETNAYFCGEKDWNNICKLFSAGCSAVREVEKATYGNETEVGSKIMIALHFADPQTSGRYAEYAANLNSAGVDYDVFASSYYPFFHGSTLNLTSVLKNIADSYGKKVMVAETSWATTLEDGDGHDNQIRIGTNDTPYYEFSVLGQATEVHTVLDAVVKVGEAGIGAFYWEPAWIPVQYAYDSNGNLNQSIRNSNVQKWETYGSGWASSYAGDYQVDAATWYGGSAMDNQAMFDMYGHPLESLKVFNYVTTGTYVEQDNIAISSATVDSIQITYGDDIKEKLPKAKVGFNNATSEEDVVVSWNQTDIEKAQAGGVGEYTIKGTVTVEVDSRSLSKDVKCFVTILPVNYMPNYSLEETNEWKFNDSNIVGIKADGNARTGTNALKFWSTSAFSYEAVIEVTIAKSGVYKFGGYIQGGDVGDDAEFTYSIQVGDSDPVTATADELMGWKNWIDTSISKVKITENNTTVTITVKGSNIAAGGWGSWDDFYIIEDTSSTTPSGGSGSVTTPPIPTTPEIPSTDDTTTTPDDTTVITNPDGTTTETKTETVTNEAGKEVEVTITANKDAEGNVTGITETSVIENIVGKADATVTVEKNAAGEITSAQAVVDKNGADTKTGVKATLSGSVVSQIAEAAGTESVEIVMTVTAGKKEYTIKADAADITAGNKLKVMAIDPKTGKYVLVNAKTYTVSEAGNVKVTLPEGATYQLLDSKDAVAVEKEILATVKVKKTSTTVKTGKKTTVQMSSKLDMDNVESITYSTSKKSVATVSKNGKVTAKKAGNVTIKVIVTLKNGQTKTVKMKVKVK